MIGENDIKTEVWFFFSFAHFKHYDSKLLLPNLFLYFSNSKSDFFSFIFRSKSQTSMKFPDKSDQSPTIVKRSADPVQKNSEFLVFPCDLVNKKLWNPISGFDHAVTTYNSILEKQTLAINISSAFVGHNMPLITCSKDTKKDKTCYARALVQSEIGKSKDLVRHQATVAKIAKDNVENFEKSVTLDDDSPKECLKQLIHPTIEKKYVHQILQ